MASIEDEIKSKNFSSEHVKAQINILFTANWLNNKTNNILKPFGLSQEQFNVLRILRGKHPEAMCQKDILSRMIARQSNLTLLIDKLTKKNLIKVKASAIDKRQYAISIHANGIDLLQQIDLIFNSQEGMLDQLNTSEAFHLNALLDKIRDVDEA